MDAQDILTGFVTATLLAGLALIVALPLASALLSAGTSGIKNRLGAAQGRFEAYFLDWRRSFF